MADIFVSYTSGDRDWAFWIGQELLKLDHAPHIHEWEILAGGDIPAWMEQRLQEDRVLCVVSADYLTMDYSGWERRSVQWAAASKRPNFMLPVFVEDCAAPVAMAHIKRCALFGLDENDARARLTAYLAEAKPPETPVRFPGEAKLRKRSPSTPRAFRFPAAAPRSRISRSPSRFISSAATTRSRRSTRRLGVMRAGSRSPRCMGCAASARRRLRRPTPSAMRALRRLSADREPDMARFLTPWNEVERRAVFRNIT